MIIFDHNEKYTKFGKSKRSDNKETFGLRVRQRHLVSPRGWAGGRAAFIGRARVRRSIPATSAKLDENAEKMPNMNDGLRLVMRAPLGIESPMVHRW